MPEPVIILNDLCKSYGKKEVLKHLNLTVEKGEILAVIGPSGAGKSTLLRLIDGLDTGYEGKISLFSEELTRRNIHRLRDKTGLLFQKTVLFDLSVEENITLGLSYRHVARAVRKERADNALEKMNMKEYAKRNARTLSGGEGQRVAFARVLVTEPELILLDEPTANLDPLATAILEDMILEENRENNTTIIINTHDQEQALRLSTRVAVMLDGEIRQIGKPEEIMNHPADTETARFVGFQNILKADTLHGACSDGFIVIRAEDIDISNDSGRISGVVTSLHRRGAVLEIMVDAGEPVLVSYPWKDYQNQFSVGSKIFLSWDEEMAVFVQR